MAAGGGNRRRCWSMQGLSKEDRTRAAAAAILSQDITRAKTSDAKITTATLVLPEWLDR